MIAGSFFITPHAVRRYRERVPGKSALTYEAALAELIRDLDCAHFVKHQNGVELWRGSKPHRLRYRVSRSFDGAPQVITVLRGCDC